MKTLLITAALSMATLVSVNAQNTNTTKRGTDKSTSGKTMDNSTKENSNKRNATNTRNAATNDAQQPRTSADYSQDRTDRMVKDFGLNEDQTNRLRERNNRYYSDYDAMNGRDMTDADRETIRTRSRESYDNDLRGIFDDKQYERYNSTRDSYNDDDLIQPAERATTPNNQKVDPYQRPTE